MPTGSDRPGLRLPVRWRAAAAAGHQGQQAVAAGMGHSAGSPDGAPFMHGGARRRQLGAWYCSCATDTRRAQQRPGRGCEYNDILGSALRQLPCRAGSRLRLYRHSPRRDRSHLSTVGPAGPRSLPAAFCPWRFELAAGGHWRLARIRRGGPAASERRLVVRLSWQPPIATSSKSTRRRA